MAVPSGGSGEHTLNPERIPAGVRDALQLYFRKDEAKTLVMKVTAINHTVDYLKVGLAGLAVGLTLVKADFTLFKVDEKGVSWLGNTLYTFPWAKEGHNWWRKIAPDKLVEKFDAKENEKKELREYIDRTFYQASEGNALKVRVDNVETTAREAHEGVAKIRKSVAEAAKSGDLLTPQAARGTSRQVAELRAAVTALSTALTGA
ncbi:hypothetical protein [Streptomyces sp. YKOK-I1]